MYDLIGDIHGHADALKELLKKLGYEVKQGAYRHPERKVIFVGDYIDRGPQIAEVLDIVYRMVNEESAIAVMGNHEYNAVCFHREKKGGGHLRPHLIKNIKQHAETLLQFQNKQEAYNKYIKWFKTLPLWYENEQIRVVHACWNRENIGELKTHIGDPYLDDESIILSSQKGTDMYRLVEETLKGKEMAMPPGKSFFDKDGHERSNIRIKWWPDPQITSFRDMSIISMDKHLPGEIVGKSDYQHYKKTDKPVFFGHYWLRGEPNLYRGNICCLDYSIAKGGHLVAYSYDEGESTIKFEVYLCLKGKTR